MVFPPLPVQLPPVPTTSDAEGMCEVVLEGASFTANFYQLHKLLKDKNPDMGILERIKAMSIPSTVQKATNAATVVLRAPKAEALSFAAELEKYGAKVSVRTSRGVNIFPESEAPAQTPLLPPLPQSEASNDAPPQGVRWGCIIPVILVALFAIISAIDSSIKKERENKAASTPKTVAVPHKQDNTDKPAEEPAPIPDYVKETSALKPLNERIPMSFPAPSFKAKIAKDALHILPTKRGVGYDKTIARYGVKRIKKINKLLPKVAEWASYVYPPDETIIYVCVSDNRSTDNELVFFVDNEKSWGDISQRIYVSERELPDKITEPSTDRKLTQLAEAHKKMAVEVIKNALTNPETFQALTVTCEKRSSEGINVVLIEFRAKNIHGYQLKYKAEITFNTANKLNKQEISEL